MWGVTTAQAQRVSLRKSFVRSLGPVLGLVGFVVGFAAVEALVPEADRPALGREVSDSAHTAEQVVRALTLRHDCWTGEAPASMAGRLPGHVVVTRPGAERPVLGGEVMVGRALDHVFEGRHPRLQVHAFCP